MLVRNFEAHVFHLVHSHNLVYVSASHAMFSCFQGVVGAVLQKYPAQKMKNLGLVALLC